MSVFTPNYAYNYARVGRELIEALLAGTEGVRCEAYLPKEPKEDQKEYETRVKRSVLFNHFARTIQAATGKVLSKPITVDAVEGSAVFDWVENIDAEGNHLDQFVQAWFADGIAQGISYVLVEMPQVAIPENGVRTLRDDRVQGIRPYLVHIPKKNLIATNTTRINGVRVLTEARVLEYEYVTGPDFSELLVKRVRVLRPGSWTVYQEGIADPIDSGTTGLDFIPLVPFYAKKSGPFEGSSPFQNLAELNIRHFQSSSEQANILRVARLPILHIARSKTYDEEGKADSQELTLSGNQAIETNAEDKIAFVEHTGKAIEAGRQDIQDLEEQMNAVSFKLAPRQTSGDITATETSVTSAEAHVFLTAMAGNFKDALELTFQYMCRMANNGEEVSVRLNKDFGSVQTATDMPLLLQMAKDGIINKETVAIGAQRRGLIPEDVTVASVMLGAEVTIDSTADVIEEAVIQPPAV